MSDITPPTTGDFDLAQRIFSSFEECDASIGVSLGAGNRCEKASSTATDDNNLGGMMSQGKL
jgi:hypothetical protein